MIFTVALGSDGLAQLTSTADPSFNGSAASVEVGEEGACEVCVLTLLPALGSMVAAALLGEAVLEAPAV
ncbi:hypothetical protein [Streptomyces sp. NPDC056628]|uniref:hypothetical protein n=1 Tax=Streptomyces sp. NPDC056628 TaxID=3345882 RepID=UPI00369C639B